jgi:tripartite ATP-independent transporter DctM subunit
MLTLIALPSVIKRGYSKSLAGGTCCAGGVLGILIPPSIMIVIYAFMASLPIGKLLFGAFFPGFTLAFLYLIYIAVRSYLEPDIGPPVPPELRTVPFLRKMKMLLVSLVPPAILVMAVLGVIFFGIAAATEAAGVGAFAATLLTIAYRRFNWQVLSAVMTSTTKLCGFILLVGAMSFAFTGVFLGAGGGKVVSDAITAMPGGRWGAFLAIQFIVFLLGFFIDWIGIVFIMVPIMTPMFEALGFDPVWAAIMVCVNLQTSFMTPPFAMAIYICKGAADPALGVSIADIIRGVIPFVLLILVGMVLMVMWPDIILWLPSKMIMK